jgi:hypothetical protein
MSVMEIEDAILQRVQAMNKRVTDAQHAGLYFYNQPVSELRGGAG